MIVARLTAEIPAAIATIAVRGERAADVVLSLATLKTKRLEIGRVHFGTWNVSTKNDSSDSCAEHLVVCRTRENQVELHCHGGNAVCESILRTLSVHGCRLIKAQNWPSEYKCPISQAAEEDLLLTSTDQAAAVLIDQLEGAFAGAVRSAIAQLQSASRHEAEATLLQLLGWSSFGCHLAEPWRIVFAGPPNVGKSSLMNAISGQPRSIVHHEPGTTRDWVESHTAIAGWPVSLTDTAGIRDSCDRIEIEGVRLARERVELADLLVLVVDASQGWTATHDELSAVAVPNKIVAWNKADLVSEIPRQPSSPIQSIPTSTIGTPGIEQLVQVVAHVLVPKTPNAGTAVPFRQSQTEPISVALKRLQAGDCASAIAQLERVFQLTPFIEPNLTR